eukprot:4868827-Pyramimonas_sp.AAC.1
MLVGLDAGNLVYTAAFAIITRAIGLGVSRDDSAQAVDSALTPPRRERPNTPAAWRSKEACIPTTVTRRRPKCWQ